MQTFRFLCLFELLNSALQQPARRREAGILGNNFSSSSFLIQEELIQSGRGRRRGREGERKAVLPLFCFVCCCFPSSRSSSPSSTCLFLSHGEENPQMNLSLHCTHTPPPVPWASLLLLLLRERLSEDRGRCEPPPPPPPPKRGLGCFPPTNHSERGKGFISTGPPKKRLF